MSLQSGAGENLSVPAHTRVDEGTTSSGLKEKTVLPSVTDLPNGGLTAWLQVVGAFFLFFNSW